MKAIIGGLGAGLIASVLATAFLSSADMNPAARGGLSLLVFALVATFVGRSMMRNNKGRATRDFGAEAAGDSQAGVKPSPGKAGSTPSDDSFLDALLLQQEISHAEVDRLGADWPERDKWDFPAASSVVVFWDEGDRRWKKGKAQASLSPAAFFGNANFHLEVFAVGELVFRGDSSTQAIRREDLGYLEPPIELRTFAHDVEPDYSWRHLVVMVDTAALGIVVRHVLVDRFEGKDGVVEPRVFPLIPPPHK
jgi:hypothetical protein